MLDLLARQHLIQQTRSGRYGMHDLLRAYARELAAAHDAQVEQDVALTRWQLLCGGTKPLFAT